MAEPLSRRAGGWARRLLLRALMIAGVLASVEAMGAAVCWFLIRPDAPFLVWDPNIDNARRVFESDWSVSDEELVWPTNPTLYPRDHTGAKLNPDFPDPARACAAAYGDFFVWGDDIPPGDGWIEQLSRRLGCRVSNFGVSGYGTDQAYLRFHAAEGDRTPVTLLGLFPENIMRNVNQYRGFLGMSWGPLALKGRFRLDAAGTLQWVPRPRLTPPLFPTFQHHPEKIIPYEYFLPDTQDGPVSLRVPYTAALVRLALMPRVRVGLSGRPVWSKFYAAGHASGALPLTLAITAAFAHEAEQRGKRLIVVILPSASSFRGQAAHGEFEYVSLVHALRQRQIEVLELGSSLLSVLGGQSYCLLYSDSGGCKGHYGREGGALLAQIVARELEQRGARPLLGTATRSH